MKRTIRQLRNCVAFLLTTTFVLCFTPFATSVWAQTEEDAAESMGVGLESRFASGAKPIAIQRTKIVPGTPMTVNSTMSNILTSNSGASFGGILARYDMSDFGKFFGTGTMQRQAGVSSARVDALTGLDQGDNEIENVEAVDRMYPPRLVIDFQEFPTRMNAKTSPEAIKAQRASLATQIDSVLERCDFDRQHENVRIENVGSKIYLRGNVKTQRVSSLLENVLAINYGGDAVVNELVVEGADTKNVDLFGRPIEAKLP